MNSSLKLILSVNRTKTRISGRKKKKKTKKVENCKRQLKKLMGFRRTTKSRISQAKKDNGARVLRQKRNTILKQNIDIDRWADELLFEARSCNFLSNSSLSLNLQGKSSHIWFQNRNFFFFFLWVIRYRGWWETETAWFDCSILVWVRSEN